MRKKTKFVLLLSFVTVGGIQVCQAYKLRCPTIDMVTVKQKGNQYEYSAKMKIDEDRDDKDIIMMTLHKKKLNLSPYAFEVGSVSSDNRFFCSYVDQNPSDTQGSLTLIAPLKKGSICSATYPKGHEHPELFYFECED